MKPVVERLQDGWLWLRVADSSWDDPLDPSFAADQGGRWNPPKSFPTLYLNEDLATAKLQIEAMTDGFPVRPDDLDDGFDLIVATLPGSQDVADAVTESGLVALGLPKTYPRYGNGRPVRRGACQPVGREVHDAGLRGVKARSALADDRSGRELAWYPARPSSHATLVRRIPFREWWSLDQL